MDEIKERIKSLKGQNSYTKETIEYMKNKMDDEIVEKSRSGSHGIGKIASNAASDLYMMYFTDVKKIGDNKTKFFPFENKFNNAILKNSIDIIKNRKESNMGG